MKILLYLWGLVQEYREAGSETGTDPTFVDVAVTKTYRTVSSEALLMSARVLPIEYTTLIRQALYLYKRSVSDIYSDERSPETTCTTLVATRLIRVTLSPLLSTNSYIQTGDRRYSRMALKCMSPTRNSVLGRHLWCMRTAFTYTSASSNLQIATRSLMLSSRPYSGFCGIYPLEKSWDCSQIAYHPSWRSEASPDTIGGLCSLNTYLVDSLSPRVLGCR